MSQAMSHPMGGTKTMRIMAAGLLTAALAGPALADQSGAPRCLWRGNLLSTETVNDATILFRMRGGVVYRNRLPVRCFGLKTYGFGYTTPENNICDSMVITVLRTHMDCRLGRFERVTPSR